MKRKRTKREKAISAIKMGVLANGLLIPACFALAHWAWSGGWQAFGVVMGLVAFSCFNTFLAAWCLVDVIETWQGLMSEPKNIVSEEARAAFQRRMAAPVSPDELSPPTMEGR